MLNKNRLHIALSKLFPKLHKQLERETFVNPIVRLIEERQLMKLLTALVTKFVYLNIVLYGILAFWHAYQDISFVWLLIPPFAFISSLSFMFILAIKMGNITSILNDLEAENEEDKATRLTPLNFFVPIILGLIPTGLFIGFVMVVSSGANIMQLK